MLKTLSIEGITMGQGLMKTAFISVLAFLTIFGCGKKSNENNNTVEVLKASKSCEFDPVIEQLLDTSISFSSNRFLCEKLDSKVFEVWKSDDAPYVLISKKAKSWLRKNKFSFTWKRPVKSFQLYRGVDPEEYSRGGMALFFDHRFIDFKYVKEACFHISSASHPLQSSFIKKSNILIGNIVNFDDTHSKVNLYPDGTVVTQFDDKTLFLRPSVNAIKESDKPYKRPTLKNLRSNRSLRELVLLPTDLEIKVSKDFINEALGFNLNNKDVEYLLRNRPYFVTEMKGQTFSYVSARDQVPVISLYDIRVTLLKLKGIKKFDKQAFFRAIVIANMIEGFLKNFYDDSSVYDGIRFKSKLVMFAIAMDLDPMLFYHIATMKNGTNEKIVELIQEETRLDISFLKQKIGVKDTRTNSSNISELVRRLNARTIKDIIRKNRQNVIAMIKDSSEVVRERSREAKKFRNYMQKIGTAYAKLSHLMLDSDQSMVDSLKDYKSALEEIGVGGNLQEVDKSISRKRKGIVRAFESFKNKLDNSPTFKDAFLFERPLLFVNQKSLVLKRKQLIEVKKRCGN